MELRRSPHLVLYWQDDRLLLHNYAIDRLVAAEPLLVSVLDAFRSWRRLADYLDEVPAGARESLAALVESMLRDRWLWRRGDLLLPAERGMEAWGTWNPAAGLFHAATRNVEVLGLEDLLPRLAVRSASVPMPPALTTRAGADLVRLPPAQTTGEFPGVLRDRRTWRRFSADPVPLQALATLLDLTAGVQHWAEAEGEGPVVLKTSPSGGARHPIELYVAVRNVSGLEPGFYHFEAGEHALAPLPDAGAPVLDEILPTQWWYRDAAAVLLFTAVFERTRWRYVSPRAYRAVLLEAGHVCQTCCLAATWLGLAPFCSMALDDAAIERALGLDGVSESVLYAAGVGTRPVLGEGERAGEVGSRE